MTDKPLANDMSDLLDKIEDRLGLIPLTPHLPCTPDLDLSKRSWGKTIMKDTLVTFSRYFPYKFPLVVNDETCYKEYGEANGVRRKSQELMHDNSVWYIIKDEVLQGIKLLGITDIDWEDLTTDNASLSSSLGGGMYLPGVTTCPEALFGSVLTLQMNADFMSLYNNGIYIDFRYPNRFAVKGLGNTNYDLRTFVVNLLIQHRDLSTISPTTMESFEALAQADIANKLWKNLRYWDGLDTVYINIDLKLAELQEEASKREPLIEQFKEATVSNSNVYGVQNIWSI